MKKYSPPSNSQEIKVEIDKVIAGIVDEFNKTINVLKRDNSLVRMKLLIAFSFAEIMSGIYGKFYDLNLGNKDLMKRWFKAYCLTEKNEIFNKRLYIRKVDENYLYELRCSIMHAFALPEQKDNRAIMFLNGPETGEDIKEIDKKFTAAGFITVFISSDTLTALFLNGGICLTQEIFNSEEAASPQYFERLKKIHKEFYRRGAVPIPLKAKS